MKKIVLIIFCTIFLCSSVNSDTKINAIYEGDINAKINLIIYESLTCGHCADFHKNIYPELKKDFIDTGHAKIEFRSFPLDGMAFNASKIAHCKNDGNSEILHFLFINQNKWLKGETLEDANNNLKSLLNSENFDLDYEKCLNNKKIEDYVLEDRIEGLKKFDINSTPTLIINDKKFDKPLDYKNLKKTLEKMI